MKSINIPICYNNRSIMCHIDRNGDEHAMIHDQESSKRRSARRNGSIDELPLAIHRRTHDCLVELLPSKLFRDLLMMPTNLKEKRKRSMPLIEPINIDIDQSIDRSISRLFVFFLFLSFCLSFLLVFVILFSFLFLPFRKTNRDNPEYRFMSGESR